MMERCGAVSETGSICTQGKGHVGPHVVGNPYYPTEQWAQDCDEHDFMPNKTWQECWKCGERKP